MTTGLFKLLFTVDVGGTFAEFSIESDSRDALYYTGLALQEKRNISRIMVVIQGVVYKELKILKKEIRDLLHFEEIK